MIDHAGFHVADVQKSKKFYEVALAPLGYVQTAEYAEWNVVGYGVAGKSDFWLIGDGAEKASHVAFRAENKETVEKFYEAAMAAGGTDNGAPGYRKDYDPGYFAAFIRDLDGHNVEAVFHDPNPT